AVGIQRGAESERVGGRGTGPELRADGVVHAAEEADVRAVDLPRALADPDEVRGAVVPLAGERVAARERLLVVEQQRFVARPDVDLVQRRVRGVEDADRL